MPILVKLNGGIEIYVENGDFQALYEAFESALTQSKPFEIRSPGRTTLVVNPHNVLYFEGPSDATERSADNGAASSQAVPA